MKRIEDIENMSLDSLLQKAREADIDVPADLEEGIAERLDEERVKTGKPRLGLSIAAAVAAVAASVLMVRSVDSGAPADPVPTSMNSLVAGVSAEPEDTFDDPELAYAAVERALGMFSEVLSGGASEAMESEAHFTRTREQINTILK